MGLLLVATLLTANAACDDVAATVEQAHGALLAADFEGAIALRRRAEENVGCGPPLAHEVLAELWLVEGVMAGLNGEDDAAGRAFAAAKALDPSGWDAAFGADLGAIWDAATYPDATGRVELSPAVEAPWVVLVDGSEAPLPADLPAGLHAVQVHHEGVVRFGQILRVTEDSTVRLTHTLPASPKGLPDPTPSSGAAVSVSVGLGVSSAFGVALEGGEAGREGAAKVITPVEVGLQAESPEVWVRGAAAVGASLTGPFLYARDGEGASSPVAVGGYVAGGPVLGPVRLGVLAGAQWPGRIPLRVVGGFPLGELPLRIEPRAGINLATERKPEPAFGAVVTYVPWL